MDNFRVIDDKKFMWDGEDYESKSSAQENMATYNQKGFTTKLIEEDGKFFVFTRRVVTEIIVEGEPV